MEQRRASNYRSQIGEALVASGSGGKRQIDLRARTVQDTETRTVGAEEAVRTEEPQAEMRAIAQPPERLRADNVFFGNGLIDVAQRDACVTPGLWQAQPTCLVLVDASRPQL